MNNSIRVSAYKHVVIVDPNCRECALTVSYAHYSGYAVNQVICPIEHTLMYLCAPPEDGDEGGDLEDGVTLYLGVMPGYADNYHVVQHILGTKVLYYINEPATTGSRHCLKYTEYGPLWSDAACSEGGASDDA